MRVIDISTDKEKIYKQYLTILNPILTKRKLTLMEIDVLSNLLYIDNLYSQYNKETRDKILFNKITKTKIRSLIKISGQSYNNILTSLRKKDLIIKKSLNINIPIVDNKLQIHYNLNITS